MIPAWKIARELNRVKEQAKDALLAGFYRRQQERHDQNKNARMTVHQGAIPLTGKVVIYLVYQPNGVPASIIDTLRHLRHAGYAPFTVLNSSVSDADLTRLKDVSACVMTRPNFGYDFGGYRDAVLHLLDGQTPMETVVFLNDSIWFPVFDNCDHLQRMEGIDADLVGYCYAKQTKKKKQEHIQSYFFMFKGEAFLKSHTFSHYWRGLRVANSRQFTIRNSEMKMTQHFLEQGRTTGWLFSADDLAPFIERGDHATLRACLDYYIRISKKSASAFRKALADPTADLQATMMTELADGNLGRNLIGGPPGLVFGRLGFGAIKKSNSHNYRVQRALIVEQGLDASFNPTVAEEIKARL